MVSVPGEDVDRVDSVSGGDVDSVSGGDVDGGGDPPGWTGVPCRVCSGCRIAACRATVNLSSVAIHLLHVSKCIISSDAIQHVTQVRHDVFVLILLFSLFACSAAASGLQARLASPRYVRVGRM